MFTNRGSGIAKAIFLALLVMCWASWAAAEGVDLDMADSFEDKWPVETVTQGDWTLTCYRTRISEHAIGCMIHTMAVADDQFTAVALTGVQAGESSFELWLATSLSLRPESEARFQVGNLWTRFSTPSLLPRFRNRLSLATLATA